MASGAIPMPPGNVGPGVAQVAVAIEAVPSAWSPLLLPVAVALTAYTPEAGSPSVNTVCGPAVGERANLVAPVGNAETAQVNAYACAKRGCGHWLASSSADEAEAETIHGSKGDAAPVACAPATETTTGFFPQFSAAKVLELLPGPLSHRSLTWTWRWWTAPDSFTQQ